VVKVNNNIILFTIVSSIFLGIISSFFYAIFVHIQGDMIKDRYNGSVTSFRDRWNYCSIS
jgi:hypothetical protein